MRVVSEVVREREARGRVGWCGSEREREEWEWTMERGGVEGVVAIVGLVSVVAGVVVVKGVVDVEGLYEVVKLGFTTLDVGVVVAVAVGVDGVLGETSKVPVAVVVVAPPVALDCSLWSLILSNFALYASISLTQ